MAGFKAHFSFAAVTGGVGATALLSAGVIDTNSMLFCFSAAILGGLLPDIDSDTSTPLQVSFTLFALIFSFLVMFSQAATLSTLELLIIWLGAFLFFKLIIFELFTRLTVHRGIFHSIPAAFLSLFLTTLFLRQLFHLDNQTAWIVGSFVLIGFISHLLLDELASLNFLGLGGVKHSFGTALKFYSPSFVATFSLYLALAFFYLLAPSSDGLVDQLLSTQFWYTLADGLLPTGGWFRIKLSLWSWWNL
ncbi:MAG: metal-dependent hydrolase [Magnetococcales bacterium]|nr:metal-dependent hydrolase [Magnetococcales bacterium]